MGTFPLRVENLAVTNDNRINDIVPNAPYALKKALREKHFAFVRKSERQLLAEYGFKSVKEAMDTFAGKPTVLNDDTIACIRHILFKHAPDTLSWQPNYR